MADFKDPENTLLMETSQGDVVIELLPDLSTKAIVNASRNLLVKAFTMVLCIPPGTRRVYGAGW